jgi:hypothetical protein
VLGPHSWLAISGVIIACLVLPESLALVFLCPAALIISDLFDLPALLTLGDADFHLADLILPAVAFKVASKLAVGRRQIKVRPLVPPGVWCFVVVMFFATLVSYIRFGREVFLQELVPLSRFIVWHIASLYLLLLNLASLRDLRRAGIAVRWLGYFAAGSIHLSLILHGLGTSFGEINAGETYVRYQGLFGDSVKLLLLPFIFVEVHSGRFIQAGFIAVALAFAGGRWGFIGLLVGLAAMVAAERGAWLKRGSFAAFSMLVVALGLALLANVGGLATRFTSPEQLELGLGQRWATWEVAGRMFMDNPLTGLGFGGYRLFVGDYLTSVQTTVALRPFESETFSQVLKSLVDAGTWGAIAFLWMMWGILKALKTGAEVSHGDLRSLLAGAYVFALTMLLISPFEVWLLPAAQTSHLMFMLVGLALQAAGMKQPSVQEAAVMRKAEVEGGSSSRRMWLRVPGGFRAGLPEG